MLKAIIILGPTAVGKTGVSLLLAERIGAEIISADSMQVYRGMDVATAKPSAADLRRIPHHLIDILKADDSYSAARFRELALDSTRQITRAGKMPLIVGGSGLYLRALVDGLSDFPPADWELRRSLREEEKKNGPGHLYNRLREMDPAAAARIHPHDLKRTVRALEVIELKGRPLSGWERKWPVFQERGTTDEGRGTEVEGCEFFIFGLRRDRKDLYRRIDERVEEMFRKGLIEETKGLMERGASRNRVAWQALGYKEVEGFLRGEYPLEEARRRLARNTRHFARRQMIWWRRDGRIKWVDIAPGEGDGGTVKKILKLLETM